MKKFNLLILVSLSLTQVQSQITGSVQTEILDQHSKPAGYLLALDLEDYFFLDSLSYRVQKLEENIYGWSQKIQKTIKCAGTVEIRKYLENKSVKSFCLVCIINQEVSKADACIQINLN